jgi:cysteine desulfurase
MAVYLDNHSTTKVDPRVVEAMLPFFTETYGNAASRSHAFGWAAEASVDAARAQVGALIGASAAEIVFTSGATESNNLALKGVAELHGSRGRHIVTSAIEHKAVLDSCHHLERQGFSVTVVAPEDNGIVNPEAVERAITADTILVSVMLVNNEMGAIQPIEAIGRVARERKVLFHCDAVQGIGRTPFDVERMHVDLASISAHKIYGPKGIGALFVRRARPRVQLIAQIDGGGHERALRSGTLNVPAIVGFGRACEIMASEGEGETARIRGLRERLFSRLDAELDGVFLNGDAERRHAGNLNVSFAGVRSDALMGALRDVAVSSGSACTSASLEPSYVLRAMGIDEERAAASIRFGVGRFNTEAEIDFAAGRVVDEVKKLRQPDSGAG